MRRTFGSPPPVFSRADLPELLGDAAAAADASTDPLLRAMASTRAAIAELQASYAALEALAAARVRSTPALSDAMRDGPELFRPASIEQALQGLRASCRRP